MNKIVHLLVAGFVLLGFSSGAGKYALAGSEPYQRGCCRVMLLPHYDTSVSEDTVRNGVVKGGRWSAQQMDAKCIDTFKATGVCDFVEPNFRCTKLGDVTSAECMRPRGNEPSPTPKPGCCDLKQDYKDSQDATKLWSGACGGANKEKCSENSMFCEWKVGSPTACKPPVPQGCCGVNSKILRDPSAQTIFERTCKTSTFDKCEGECEWYTDKSKCVAPPKGCCGLKRQYQQDPTKLSAWRSCAGKYNGDACDTASDCAWYTDLSQCKEPVPAGGCCGISDALKGTADATTDLFKLCKAQPFKDCVNSCAWFMDTSKCTPPPPPRGGAVNGTVKPGCCGLSSAGAAKANASAIYGACKSSSAFSCNGDCQWFDDVSKCKEPTRPAGGSPTTGATIVACETPKLQSGACSVAATASCPLDCTMECGTTTKTGKTTRITSGRCDSVLNGCQFKSCSLGK